jgi:protocatechuate 3,4-dioxygenase alpha subunit
MSIKQTPSQTVGPFFAYGLTPEQYGYALDSIAGSDLVPADYPTETGTRIRIEGNVIDGAGTPINDAMIEIWQADEQGRYSSRSRAQRRNVGFVGFGRCGTGTDPDLRYVFETLKPGAVDASQAPHISFVVFMRGLPTHVYTRMYFPEDTSAHEDDPVLNSVPEERRSTLIAERVDDNGATVYRFDIHMQGDNETVFFDF